MKPLNFATLNARGLRKIRNNDGSPKSPAIGLDLTNITTDIKKHDIAAIAIQETHFGETEHLQNTEGYIGYFVNEENNRYHGSGILIKDCYNPTFTKISSRVCTANFKINTKNDILLICGYAPHETLSNKKPEERDTFYADLQKALSLKKANTIPIIALDANAQTSFSKDETHPKVIGKYTKGTKTNVNGHTLLHFAAENDMMLTNTLFQHKMSRRTTWTAPYRPLKMKNGETRRKPIHRQIDYILLDKKQVRFVTNSRSYNSIKTDTDHNMVIMNLLLELSKMQKPKINKSPQYKIENFRNKTIKEKYQQKLEECYDNTEIKNNDDGWQQIVDTCLETGKDIIGMKEKRTVKSEDKEIKRLS